MRPTRSVSPAATICEFPRGSKSTNIADLLRPEIPLKAASPLQGQVQGVRDSRGLAGPAKRSHRAHSLLLKPPSRFPIFPTVR